MARRALCLDEREEIRAGIETGLSAAAIARRLRRHSTTVSREIRRNGGRQGYRAVRAQRRCDRRRRRPKAFKLVTNPQLGRQVEAGLRRGFSPQAVAALLRAGGGATVVHETIYRALYSPVYRGVGVLPRNCLRTRRPRRRRHDRYRSGSGAWGMKRGLRLIDERPAQVRDRVEAGHWEGDLLMGGRASGSAMITLVERTSRLLITARLPDGYDCGAVRDALIAIFGPVPRGMRRSLTWDQGNEMRLWRHTEEALELPIYFCHPRSPWERGSNENTNRQLRYWFRKGSDLNAYNQTDIDRATFIINNQPRRLLAWTTSAARYRELAML
jgi:IS30 family transposase